MCMTTCVCVCTLTDVCVCVHDCIRLHACSHTCMRACIHTLVLAPTCHSCCECTDECSCILRWDGCHPGSINAEGEQGLTFQRRSSSTAAAAALYKRTSEFLELHNLFAPLQNLGGLECADFCHFRRPVFQPDRSAQTLETPSVTQDLLCSLMP